MTRIFLLNSNRWLLTESNLEFLSPTPTRVQLNDTLTTHNLQKILMVTIKNTASQVQQSFGWLLIGLISFVSR